jgi:hypothetical protein
MYKKLHEQYPNKKFDGFFFVDSYQVFFLSWKNYNIENYETATYETTKVSEFSWNFNGDEFGDWVEMKVK